MFTDSFRGRRRGPAAALLALAATILSSGNARAQERPLTLEDVIGLRVVSEARISPNGARVAYVLLEPDSQRPVGWGASLWVVEVDGGEPRRLRDGAQAPRWSPDGRRLAFLSRDEEGGPSMQIWTIDTDDGAVARVSDSATGAAAYEWSPDGASIAYVAIDPASLPQRDPVARVHGETGPRHQLYLLDLERGTSSQLTRVAGTVHVNFFGGGSSFSWSPDGSRIAFAVQPGRSFEDAYRSDVYVVSIEEGRVRPLIERQGMDFRPLFSPDGRWVAFVSSYGAIDRLGSHGLSVVAAEGGEPRDIGKTHGQAFLDAPNGHEWTADGRALLYGAPRGATRQLLALSVADGALAMVSEGQAVHTAFTFSADRSRMAFLGSGPGRPYDVFVSPIESFQPRRLTRLNRDLEDVAMPGMETIRWRNPQGMEIEGVLVKPPDFESGRRYPLVAWMHGGPEGHAVLAFDPTVPFPLAGFDPSPIQLLAARGYVVLLPNFRGSAGYGREFLRAVIGELGPAPLEDLLSGIDHLIEAGIADPDRLGVMGWASGAYKAAHAITASRRFAAAALGAGPTELRMAYGEGDFPVQWESLMGGAPWEVPERYDRDSPLRQANEVRAATLLMHGADDALVPPIQTQQFHTMLSLSGVTTELVTYPGQGHGLLHPRARADAMRRMLDWFERWLDPMRR